MATKHTPLPRSAKRVLDYLRGRYTPGQTFSHRRAELAAACAISPASVSGALTRLQDANIITRTQAPGWGHPAVYCLHDRARTPRYIRAGSPTAIARRQTVMTDCVSQAGPDGRFETTTQALADRCGLTYTIARAFLRDLVGTGALTVERVGRAGRASRYRLSAAPGVDGPEGQWGWHELGPTGPEGPEGVEGHEGVQGIPGPTGPARMSGAPGEPVTPAPKSVEALTQITVRSMIDAVADLTHTVETLATMVHALSTDTRALLARTATQAETIAELRAAVSALSAPVATPPRRWWGGK
jgi:hypothetical protein